MISDVLSKLLTETNLNQEDYILILKSLYDLDFNLYLKNNSDINLVLDLIKYGLDISQLPNDDLFKRCENNLACLDAYNIITSYKSFIKGLCNDLNLYDHFNYFFIPKFAVLKGRKYN